jgi:hypothetical protein
MWNGQPVVATGALRAHGIEDPELGLVVALQGRAKMIYIELDTRVTMRDENGQHLEGWLVTRIDPDGAFDDAAPEDIIGGHKAP